jgi:hypothetical protein
VYCYILIRKEEPERAVLLLSAAEAIRGVIDIQRTKKEQVEYEGEIASLQNGMDSAQFEEHWKKGYSLSMDQAIQLALG